MIVLNTQHISKGFGGNAVLRGVSLTLQSRDRVGLVGVNGCGKTTLLRVLCGELAPDGGTISSFNSSSRIISANPRTAIGYYEPGHYCLVVVDGRGDSAGISLPELSQLFSDLGCKAAYNLDGGNSSIMVWQNDVINNPSGGGRESSDALLIAEVRSHA